MPFSIGYNELVQTRWRFHGSVIYISSAKFAAEIVSLYALRSYSKLLLLMPILSFAARQVTPETMIFFKNSPLHSIFKVLSDFLILTWDTKKKNFLNIFITIFYHHSVKFSFQIVKWKWHWEVIDRLSSSWKKTIIFYLKKRE